MQASKFWYIMTAKTLHSSWYQKLVRQASIRLTPLLFVLILKEKNYQFQILFSEQLNKYHANTKIKLFEKKTGHVNQTL